VHILLNFNYHKREYTSLQELKKFVDKEHKQEQEIAPSMLEHLFIHQDNMLPHFMGWACRFEFLLFSVNKKQNKISSVESLNKDDKGYRTFGIHLMPKMTPKDNILDHQILSLRSHIRNQRTQYL